MATIIRYVNTAAAGGGDGTTNGTGAGGVNAFASLSAAEAALRQDLTGVTCDVADEGGNNYIALDILCSGTTADSTAVVFSNAAWVTDATHRVRVRLNGTGAGPKWDSSLYRLAATHTSLVGVINVGKAIHLTLQDLQVESLNALDQAPQAVTCGDFAWDVRLVRCFLRATSTTGTAYRPAALYIDAGTASWTLRAQNTVLAMAEGRALWDFTYHAAGVSAILYNCTMVNRSGTPYGIFELSGSGTSEMRAKNLLIQGAGTNYSIGDSVDEAVTILTSDATSPTVGLRSLTATFVDATNWDYHLAAASEGIDDGTDLSADSYYAFSTDGDGATRSGTWDVGADEYAASGASPVFFGRRR